MHAYINLKGRFLDFCLGKDDVKFPLLNGTLIDKEIFKVGTAGVQ